MQSNDYAARTFDSYLNGFYFLLEGKYFAPIGGAIRRARMTHSEIPGRVSLGPIPRGPSRRTRAMHLGSPASRGHWQPEATAAARYSNSEAARLPACHSAAGQAGPVRRRYAIRSLISIARCAIKT